MQKIYRFIPIYKTTLWGGRRLATLKGAGVPAGNVGESWDISGVKGDLSVVADGCGDDAGLTLNELLQRYRERLVGARNYERYGDEFPLLIKFIDATRDLSVQVHPGDELARERHGSSGKAETWYIVDALAGSRLMCGLSKQLDKKTFIDAVNDHSIVDCLSGYSPLPGDVFNLPAGRVHAIGAGCLIAEIQQAADITYRIYDYNRTDENGRLRTLHVDWAVDAIDYNVLPDYRIPYAAPQNGEATLVQTPYYTTRLCAVAEGESVELEPTDSFRILVGVENSAAVTVDGETTVVSCGHSVLIPAAVSCVRVGARDKSARVLVVTIE